MILYPALDLRGGHVVRLAEGDPDRQTTFSDDPTETAQRWIDAGAEWLHVVNLDGAFDDDNDNLSVMRTIAALGVPVQFGGGLRDLDAVARALDHGASRVVLGTLAVTDPEAVGDAIARFGADAICVGLDARDGRITTHGWRAATEWTPVAFGKAMRERNVKHALYTDVRRDGGLTGADIDGTITLAQETGLHVIASGGVTSIGEIRTLAASGAVAGAIIGMALYTGRIRLQDALHAAQKD